MWTSIIPSTTISPTIISNQHRQPAASSPKLRKSLSNLTDALQLLESRSCPETLHSYSLLLHACITKRSLQDGRRLHLHLLSRPNILPSSPALQAKLITMYAVCDHIHDARHVFDESVASSTSVPPSVWSAMLIGYSTNGLSEEALCLYADMLSQSVLPGNFAFSAVLKSCSDSLSEFGLGRAVHAQILKSQHAPDQVVNNALLRLYAVSGSLDDARRVFDTMPVRNTASWNSFLAGLISQDRVAETLELFRMMQDEGVGFSWVTLTTILPVCARLTSLRSGKEIHAQIVKASAEPDVPVRNSLMDMYAKCGAMKFSQYLFEKMGDRDLMSWNIMLTGCAINGRASEAVELFNEMVQAGIRPDSVTFIAVLSACSHAGIVAEGWRLFDRMDRDFGVSPTAEHFACLVDLLGRAGHIKEAMRVVEKMPMSPTASIWGSLLNSCQLHHNIELGETVAKQLFELEPFNPGNYVILSNMYATVGRWGDVKEVRELMEKRGIRKEVGCSWIQIKNRVHTFVAGGGVAFRESMEYKRVWNELIVAMKEAGYVPKTTGVVLHDVDEQTKAMWVCGHSEKLAVVFGLIHTSTGMAIRITKNLRVCTDCHSAMKIISKVAKRVIVLRDTHRFHHFVDGKCSCRDYW